MSLMTFTLAMWGCTEVPDAKGDDTAVETDTDTDTDADTDTDTDTDLSGLNGTEPAAPVSAPDFNATNYDGTPRSKPDLIGHPTVLWFFPFADSPG